LTKNKKNYFVPKTTKSWKNEIRVSLLKSEDIYLEYIILIGEYAADSENVEIFVVRPSLKVESWETWIL
jgi:hypothetical protein